MTMSQLKKLILVGSVSCIALAGAHGPTTKDVTGIYVGANLAYNDLGGNAKFEYTDPAAVGGDGFTYNYKYKVSSPGLGGGLFVGYRHNFDPDWFVGGEINANFYNNQTSKFESSQISGVNANPVKGVLKRSWGYGLMVDVGYVFSPKVYSYIGVQAEYASFKVQANAGGLISGVVLLDESKSKDILGFGPALGMGYRITKDITLGAQYAVTFFPATTFGHTKVTPRNNSFKVNLGWTF